jgi:Fe-S-cluster-containing hydrogenase component 2
MKRKIIKIDEAKCNGCGQCVVACPEGAIKIIDHKARLVSELYCDGLGACIGNCPQGAITIEEREAEKYDEKKTMENIVKQGPQTIVAHLEHLEKHEQKAYLQAAEDYLKEKKIALNLKELKMTKECACPGSKMVDLRQPEQKIASAQPSGKSELQQWPIQLHLVNPQAPYFKEAELLVAADCTAFTYSNFQQRFLKGKILIVFCPKLDQANEVYIEKLTQIFKNNSIKSITILHMEVPCCFGTVKIVEEALKNSGRNILLKEYTISLKGEII